MVTEPPREDSGILSRAIWLLAVSLIVLCGAASLESDPATPFPRDEGLSAASIPSRDLFCPPQQTESLDLFAEAEDSDPETDARDATEPSTERNRGLAVARLESASLRCLDILNHAPKQGPPCPPLGRFRSR